MQIQIRYRMMLPQTEPTASSPGQACWGLHKALMPNASLLGNSDDVNKYDVLLWSPWLCSRRLPADRGTEDDLARQCNSENL